MIYQDRRGPAHSSMPLDNTNSSCNPFVPDDWPAGRRKNSLRTFYDRTHIPKGSTSVPQPSSFSSVMLFGSSEKSASFASILASK